jgi:ubiquinone/menaquinone biosynthesis C-methylase UbiE
VIDTVERRLPELQAKAKATKGKGSLTLDPTLEIPRYHTGADIHLQPGAYHTDSTADDIAQGAVYERGTFIYAMGGMGPENDGRGRILHKFFRKQWPNRKICKVVDMGTTIGLGIVYWAQKEPDGEFHAIDVAAPVLRYGHVRAKALGAAVHFSQQNAEKTNYADNSVDLVISHILLHETSRNAIQNIFNECHRILKPGGLMLHLDLPQAGAQSPLEGFLWEWEVYNNNEHFYGQLRELDVSEVAAKAGFDKAKFKIHQVDSTWADGQTPYSDSNFTFPVYAAEK